MLYSNTKFQKKDYVQKKAALKKRRQSINDNKTVDRILTPIIVSFTLFCLIPMILVIIVSLSSEISIETKGFSFFPSAWSLDAYRYIASFKNQLLDSYMVTIFQTVVATALSLFLNSMLAYTVSRREFLLNKYIVYLFVASMLVSGGSVSTYIVMTNIFNFRNNLLVLILPGAVSVGNIIVMRTFIHSNVPNEMVDAGRIDGAGDARIFFELVLPLLKPVLGALGFMCAVGHWNEWATAMLYIDNPKLATLQLLLVKIENNIDYLTKNLATLSPEQLRQLKEAPSEATRMAILLCVLGPVLVIYPFFQKYFIKGITIGAVKG